MQYDVESFHGEVMRLEKIPCPSGHPWSKQFFLNKKGDTASKEVSTFLHNHTTTNILCTMIG
jgi:hypothetical protein